MLRSPSPLSSAGMASGEEGFARSITQVSERVLPATPGFAGCSLQGAGQACHPSGPARIGGDSCCATTPAPAPLERTGREGGLTGRTRSPGLCSDTPRYSGSAGHSPPGAARPGDGSAPHDIMARRNLPPVAQPRARLSCPGAFADLVSISPRPQSPHPGTRCRRGRRLPGKLPAPAALPVPD